MIDRYIVLLNLAEGNPYLKEEENTTPPVGSEEQKTKKKSKQNNNQENEMTLEKVKEQSLSQYYENVKPVKDNLYIIRKDLNRLKEKGSQQLDALSVKEKKKLSDKISKISSNISDVISTLRTQLELLSGDMISGNGESVMVDRIKKNVYRVLVQEFFDLLQEYYSVQSSFEEQTKDILKHQYKIVNNREPTDDMVDEMLTNGESDQIFKTDVESYERRLHAQSALNYVKERHKEILKLRDMLFEIMELMKDMQAMVYAQGEMIDRVVMHADKIQENVEKGNYELRKAINEEKKCIVM